MPLVQRFQVGGSKVSVRIQEIVRRIFPLAERQLYDSIAVATKTLEAVARRFDKRAKGR